MQTVLLDTGTAALAQAIAEGTPLQVVGYTIGQAVNFTPSTTGTQVTPSPIYTGDQSSIAPAVVDGDEIRYVITLVETVGPFDVGNIMLFLQVGNDPTLVPYIWGVLPVPVPKLQSNPPQTIGNRLVFNLTAQYVNISSAFTLTVTSPQYSSLPNYNDENGLPSATNTAFQQGVLQNLTTTGSPAVFMRRTVDNSWYVAPFTQRLDDPNYGSLQGGVVGDGYLPWYGPWYSGAFFITPDSAYNNFLQGGTDWAVPTISDDPVQGGAQWA